MGELHKAHLAWQACSTAVFFGQRKQHFAMNDELRFSLVQSSRQSVPPFASLSVGRQAPANPLLSLSRLTGSGSSSGVGSSDAPSSSGTTSEGAASSSGYESDAGSGYSSSLHLDNIKCQMCQKPLSQRGGASRGLGWRRGRRRHHTANHFLVCDCCQQAYHEDCCKARGVSTKEGKDGSWFHSNGCRECQEGLQQQARLGPIPLPDGRTWQLIDCSPVSPKEQGATRALQLLKRSLGDVLEVLLPAYGPGVAQQLVDTSKGYAVLLRQDALPVTAGLLDVYGQECAVLDLVATVLEEQGKGHCSALLGAVEGWLGPKLGVRNLMAVCPGDEPETIRAWQQAFGFKRLNQRQLRQLQASVPPVNYYEESVLLTKVLAKKESQKQEQQ